MVDVRPIPRHEVIERHLRQRVASMEPGDPLESDAELCELFQVSRMTVRQATQRLVGEGLIYRVTGVGTFVGHPAVHRQMGTLRSFTQEMERRGQTVKSSVLRFELAPGAKPESAALRLPPGSTVLRLERLRLVDGEPMAIEHVALPPSFAWLLDVDFTDSSLHTVLAQHQHVPTHATGTQIAAAADPRDAQLLGLKPGAPLFVERRLVTDQTGAPLESTESRYAGERFVFDIELSSAE